MNSLNSKFLKDKSWILEKIIISGKVHYIFEIQAERKYDGVMLKDSTAKGIFEQIKKLK